MTKEQQDLLWSVLSKEQRDFERIKISIAPNDEYKRGYDEAYADIFGHRNLTSDIEPEEMLCIKRIDVIDAYAECACAKASYQLYTPEETKYHERMELLKSLFGDKCLPDKEEWKDTGSGAMGTTPPAVKLDVKPTPRFNKGDKVKIINVANPIMRDEIGIIEELPTETNPLYQVRYDEEHWALLEAKYLEPYTEENKETIVSKNDTMDDTKETMEEKELNLCELLKGCEGEEFYSLMHGKVRFMTIGADGFVMFDLPESISVYDNGKYDLNAEVIIYPSRVLYEKYPLDAYSAWMEWKEARKPKRWTPKHTETYWFINEFLYPDAICFNREDLEDLARVKAGNCFQTFELCNQAAEAVKETLAKFHENNEH